MTEKKISGRLDYLPARLSKKADRWEIVYYATDPATGNRSRFRETWDLNRIKDLRERKVAAARAIERINALIPQGYPFKSQAEIERKTTVPTLLAAITEAIKIKLKTDVYETSKCVQSIGGVFTAWIKATKIDTMPVEDFTRKNAHDFLDYVATRTSRSGKPLSNRTWNNYRNKTGSLFYVLVDREYIKESPFSKIKRKKVAPKSRRKFTPDERAAVASWLWDNDYLCFVAITLQYFCLFRGTELRRLRASDFNIGQGSIFLPGTKSKTNLDRPVTMPLQVQQILSDTRFSSIQAGYLVFGWEGNPHPSKPCGRGYIWRHLRKCLEALKKQGLIKNMEGLSPYGFKDTGITDWLARIPLPEVMRQAGHTNPSTTMIYYQPDQISEPFRKLDANIFDAT